MFKNYTKKAILLVSIVCATGVAFVGYNYYNQSQEAIYEFNAARDTESIMDIFNKNWYWLLASEESTPGLMLKHRTYDATNPLTFGTLKIKVLRIQDQLAGFTAYYMEKQKQGRLLFLAVDHKFRGKGYGQKLAQYAINDMIAMGARSITLWTRTSNLPAQKIYKELGFVEVFDDNGYVFFEYLPRA